MKKHLILTLFAVITLFASCKKKDDDSSTSPSYSTSYNYSNAEYADESTRLSMFKNGLEAELKKAIPSSSNTGAHSVDSTRLSNLFTNTASPFDTVSWNTNGLNLASENANATLIQTYLGKYAAASAVATYNATATPTPTAAEGVAGLATNATGGYLLLGADGINYAQLIQKVQFGTLIINQIINRLDAINDIDNTILVSGKTYTAQEHAWDAAFGYLGFPIATVSNLIDTAYVKANKSKFLYVGNYSTQTDNTTDAQITKKLVTAFIIGRAAVSSKDYATRDAQIDVIKTTLRKFLGATILQEYTEYIAKTPLDNAGRNGVVSEMIGMVIAMKYVPGRIISDAQIQDLLDHLHANDAIHGIWEVTQDEIDYVKNEVIAIYGVNLKQ
ncbi:MAG: hypothetical protein JWO58_2617 [Chitinophagaceae bacterium]|nr:hypothetical protein [Chitinophagaceae bacterium]